MSDHYLRIIPADPRFVPTQECEELAVSRLSEVLPGAAVTARRTDGVQFVDQGGNFERVLCPHCNATIAKEDWHAWMDRAYSSGFADLTGLTPCCNRPSDLNSLTYEWPAGFASFVLEAMNPGIGSYLPDESCASVARALGCSVRQILAHY